MANAISIQRIDQMSHVVPTRSGDAGRLHWRSAPVQEAHQGGDTVEVSQHARFMQQLATLPSGRMDVINRVRSQINAATYETDHKLDVAIEHLARDITR